MALATFISRQRDTPILANIRRFRWFSLLCNPTYETDAFAAVNG